MKYRSEIDGLRALAVIPVIFYLEIILKLERNIYYNMKV